MLSLNAGDGSSPSAMLEGQLREILSLVGDIENQLAQTGVAAAAAAAGGGGDVAWGDDGDDGVRQEDGGVGCTLERRQVGGDMFVVKVEEGGGCDKAGVRPGMKLVTVNGVAVKDLPVRSRVKESRYETVVKMDADFFQLRCRLHDSGSSSWGPSVSLCAIHIIACSTAPTRAPAQPRRLTLCLSLSLSLSLSRSLSLSLSRSLVSVCLSLPGSKAVMSLVAAEEADNEDAVVFEKFVPRCPRRDRAFARQVRC